jgi:methyl acetate hydrolase
MGTHPTTGATILKPETVKEYIFTDQIPRIGCSNKGIGEIPSTIPQVSRTGEFHPGVSKGWSCGLMTINEDTPNGRKKGSGAWAGLGNCYFWVDPAAGKLGFVVSAILPFFDKDVLHLFDSLERAVYGKPLAKQVAEAGSNFSGGEFLQAAAA